MLNQRDINSGISVAFLMTLRTDTFFDFQMASARTGLPNRQIKDSTGEIYLTPA